MEQLTLDEMLFPVEKNKWESYGNVLDKWIADKDSDYKMVYQIMRGSWIMSALKYGVDSAKRDIANTVETKCYHGNIGDNYIWSIQVEDTMLDYGDRNEVFKNYYIFFKMNDKIIVAPNRSQFKDISFPASIMHYFNSKGDEIDSQFRDEFIMNGLGLKEKGEIRYESLRERAFYSLKCNLIDILNYWEKGEKK